MVNKSSETFKFKAEIDRLLDIVTNSLYSNKEIFIRELISNAADACYKLKYLALSDQEKLGDDVNFKIVVEIDRDNSIIRITDNGIGMNKDDLVDKLGNIANSGTYNFIKDMKDKKDDRLIGQFGVGFYSVFMVTDKVIVKTKNYNGKNSYIWETDGRSGFTIKESEDDLKRGTEVNLHIKSSEKEFLSKQRLKSLICEYSKHIGIEIYIKDNDEKEEKINTKDIIWSREKSDIEHNDYIDFYRTEFMGFDEPYHIMHNKVEGSIEYTSLFFIPSQKPFDMFQQMQKSKIKLYTRKVLIMTDCEHILPGYMRFIKGLIDTSDIDLNISREMLQNNDNLKKIKASVTKKVLSEFLKKSKNESYDSFWDNFGIVLKEGLYDDIENCDAILKICRFYSLIHEKYISLDDYVKEMEGRDKTDTEAKKDDSTKLKKPIYYITAPNQQIALSNPQLSEFKKKGIDVLLLTDSIDKFWTANAPTYGEYCMQLISNENVEIGAEKSLQDIPKEVEKLVEHLKSLFDKEVKDVKISKKDIQHPMCFVSAKEDSDFEMARIMQMYDKESKLPKRILEINPNHNMIIMLCNKMSKSMDIDDLCWYLLDVTKISYGMLPSDIGRFTKYCFSKD